MIFSAFCPYVQNFWKYLGIEMWVEIACIWPLDHIEQLDGLLGFHAVPLVHMEWSLPLEIPEKWGKKTMKKVFLGKTDFLKISYGI